MVSVASSLSYFSVSVIKCSDEGNLKENGFGLLYSSWRIQFAMVEWTWQQAGKAQRQE